MDGQLGLSATSADHQMAIYLVFLGAPGRNRTYDLRFRKPALYPAELREREPFAVPMSTPLEFCGSKSTVRSSQ